MPTKSQCSQQTLAKVCKFVKPLNADGVEVGIKVQCLEAGVHSPPASMRTQLLVLLLASILLSASLSLAMPRIPELKRGKPNGNKLSVDLRRTKFNGHCPSNTSSAKNIKAIQWKHDRI